ncbi:tetratricopeptide repeat protein, partial [Aquimarina spongiae]
MKYILLFVGLFLFLCTNSLSAQSANDTLVAWQYYQKADSLLTIGKHDTSIESFKKALIIYEEEKHWERVANSYNKISENQWRIRDFKGALKSANEALEINNEYLKKQNKEEAYSYKNIGICNLKTYKFTKSIHYLERSLGIEKKLLPEDHISIGVTYSYIGTVNKFLSKFQKALHYQEKALNIFIKTLGSEDERVANEYNNIGNIYSAKRRFPTALRYYEKDLEITVKNLGANSMKSAVSYVNIGTVYSNIGKSHKALTYYKKAIPIFLKEEKKYALFVTYNNIGTLLTDKGEYEKALNYNKKGLDMALKIFDQNHEEVAICNWNIGFALEGKKLYDKALVYYNKALRNITLSKGENNNDVLTLYTNIGNIYLQNKKYDKAFDYYQKALRIAENIHEATNPEIARVYISIGNLYNEKSSLTKALLNYEKSMDILENSEKQHPLFLQALNQIANVYRKKGVFRESLSYFDRALVANSKNETPNLILEEINPNHFYDVNFLLETIQGKAEVLYLIYKENKKTVDLKQSFEAYNKADLLIDYLRESYKNRKDKISFARRAKEVYQGAIKTQLLLHKQQGNPDELNKAFFFAEKSMGNILKELLNFSTTKEFRKLSADIISLEKDLKIDKAFYLSQVAEEQSKKSKINTAKVQEFENQLFDINRKQDSLTTLIETNYPKYYNLKYQNKVISVADIQSKLDEQTTLLEFFTSDNSTYTFTISKNNIDVQELATPDLANKVYGFKQSIISKDLKV